MTGRLVSFNHLLQFIIIIAFISHVSLNLWM